MLTINTLHKVAAMIAGVRFLAAIAVLLVVSRDEQFGGEVPLSFRYYGLSSPRSGGSPVVTDAGVSLNRAAAGAAMDFVTMVVEIYYARCYGAPSAEAREWQHRVRFGVEYAVSVVLFQLIMSSYAGVAERYAGILLPLVVAPSMWCVAINTRASLWAAWALLLFSSVPVLSEVMGSGGDAPDFVYALIAGVYLVYGTYGGVGEYAFRNPGWDPDGWYTSLSTVGKTYLVGVTLPQLIR